MKSSAIAIKIWIMALALSLLMVTAAMCSVVNQDQKDQLKELAIQTRQKTKAERQNVSRARQEIFNIYSKYDLNENRARVAITKIEQAQLRLLNIHFEHQIGIRKILNSGQFEKFKERIGNKMRDRGNGSIDRMKDADVYADKTLLDGTTMSSDRKQKAQSRFNELARRRAEIISSMHGDFKQMMGIYSNYNLDAAAAKRLIAQTHKQQCALLELNLRRQKAIRSLLNENQFNTFMSNVSSKMKDQKPGQKDRC